MKRRLIAVVLLVALIAGSVPAAYAHPRQAEHDEDLKYVLFGSRDKHFDSEEERRAFQAIADAASLAIDQFSSNSSSQLKKDTYEDLQTSLQDMGLPQLPFAFDSIDLNAAVSADGKGINANSHRKYTHQGWNYRDYPNPKFWETRQQVLLHVANWTLFQNRVPPSWLPAWVRNRFYAPSEQCEAFCTLIYCVHLLGDHAVADSPEKLKYLEPLIAHSNMSAPGIIAELSEQLQVVFVSQRYSWRFSAMMEDLSALEFEIEQEFGVGRVDTAEKCSLNQKHAEQLLDLLAKHLPELLKNEPFFSARF